jgi:hypothetical protein
MEKRISQSYASLRKEHTGDTRLLNGWGGRIGITMRKITKADAIKDKKASARATTRESMFLKFNRYLSKERKSLYMRKDVWPSLNVSTSASTTAKRCCEKENEILDERLFGFLFGLG